MSRQRLRRTHRQSQPGPGRGCLQGLSQKPAGLQGDISLQAMDGGFLFGFVALIAAFITCRKHGHQLLLLVYRKAIFNQKKEKPVESLTISAV